MAPFGLLSRIDWDYIARTWLPLISAIVGVALGLWQYHVNSRHDRATTYLSVIDRFGTTKQEFENDYKIITAEFADKGSGSASKTVPTSCALDKDKDWAAQIKCFNKNAMNEHFSSVLAVLSEFKVLGQYAASDDYAKQMLKASLHDKAVRLVLNLCGAVWTAQKYMSKLDDDAGSSPDVIAIVNQFAEPALPCDEARARAQGAEI